MYRLMKAENNDSKWEGYERLACGRCGGTKFRDEKDSLREGFAMYGDAHDMTYRKLVAPIVSLVEVSDRLVCCTCEKQAGERHPSKPLEPLVVYDPKTREQVPPTKARGLWE